MAGVDMKIGDLVEAYGKGIGVIVQVSGSAPDGVCFYLVYYPDGSCDWEDEPWIEVLNESR